MKLCYFINNWNGIDYINFCIVLENGKQIIVRPLPNDTTLYNLACTGAIEKISQKKKGEK